MKSQSKISDAKTLSPFDNEQRINATIRCPADKSLTHRGLIFAALANGRSQIINPLWGEDCKATLNAVEAVGVKVQVNNSQSEDAEPVITIVSGGWDNFTSPKQPLDFGNSGTTARLLLGVFAATPGLTARCQGDASLSRRPMARVTKPLTEMGGEFRFLQEDGFLPLIVQGKALKPQSHNISEPSAQVKSALLLAGLNCCGTTTVRLPLGSRDHTERLLINHGANCTVKLDREFENIAVTGPFRPQPATFRIPADPSSAAFFAVLGCLFDNAEIVLPHMLANPTRIGFVRVLERMGADIKMVAGAQKDKNFMEPALELRVRGGQLVKGVEIKQCEIPTMIDEIPILAVLCLFADQPSIFRGLRELRVKESDRLTKIVELLTLAGGKAEVKGDDLTIHGSLKRAKSFNYDSGGDHRMAMAASILATKAQGDCLLENFQCVTVSFPSFFDVLSSLR